MSLDPIIVEIKPPKKPPFKGPKLPFKLSDFGTPRATKIITAVATVVIVTSIVLFSIFTVLANNRSYKIAKGIRSATDEIALNNEAVKSDIALPGGTEAVGRGGTSGANSPVVTLTASQSAVTKGEKVKLSWTVTNNPTSCTASDDWSGAKNPNGDELTPSLTNLQTYIFTLTCKTSTGTGFSTVSVNAIEQGGTGTVGRPVVTMTALPSQIFVGQSTTLTWTATNSPSSCKANDDWSGMKAASGSASTGALTSAKSYKFTLTCTNSAGSGYVSATVNVSNPPPDVPVVSISTSPSGPITPGSSATLTWSATNGPTSCAASGDWTGSKATSGSQSTGPLNVMQVYGFTLTCTNASGSSFETATLQVLPNIPTVSITASPASIFIGNTSTISWSSANSPTSCTASGDWSGTKAGNGSVSTGTLLTAGTYTYRLVCDNQAGTSAAATATVTVTLPPKPVVTINANPISIAVGGSSSLTWSVTNSPTSCTASGDWSGSKASSGTASTGALSTVKTYTYALTCVNAGGSGSASTSVSVSSGAPSASPPVVTISVSPTSIGAGNSATINWSATNSPTSCTASGSWTGAKAGSGSTSTGTMGTAGTFTYTLACSNAAGSDTKSATLTVIAIPVVTISISPASITTGSSATIAWSATNSPTSCTAGGTWTGTKAVSGTQTTGTMPTAGSYIYSLSCTNAGGTGTNSTTLTVTSPAVVYCSGLTPCYGPSTLALHAKVATDCWGYQTSGSNSTIYNLTGFAPRHSGGSGTILTAANCGHAIDWTGAPSNGKHTAAKSNTQATLNGYKVGYYDAAKP